MSKTAVKKEECRECGADIRDEALYCFNCGEAIAPIVKDPKVDGISEAWFREDIAVGEAEFDEPIAKPNESLVATENEVVEQTKETIETAEPKFSLRKPSRVKEKTRNPIKSKVPMKSAATLRNKPKLAQSRKEEIIWEERSQSPNVWFMAMSVFVTIIAGVLFLLAMYFK